jgi:hypothetical protein
LGCVYGRGWRRGLGGMGGGPFHRKLRMCHNMVHRCSKERVGELMVGKLGKEVGGEKGVEVVVVVG